MDIINNYVTLIDGFKLITLGALVAANFLTGVAVSIYTKTFRLKALGCFLYSRILPYLVSYMAMGIVAMVKTEWMIAVNIVWGVIVLALIGAILANLKEMGINLPDSLAGNKEEN